MGGIENLHRSIFVSDALGVVLVHVGHCNRIRGDLNVADFICAIVLRDQSAAVRNIVHKPLVVRTQIVTHGIGPDAEHDRRKFRKIAGRDVLRRQHRDIDSQLTQCVGNRVPRPFDISNGRDRCRHIQNFYLRLRRRVDIACFDVRIGNRRVAVLELLISGLQNSLDNKVARSWRHRHHELQGGLFTFLCEARWTGLGRRAPAGRQDQAHFPIHRRRILVLNIDGELFLAVSLQRNNGNAGRHTDRQRRNYFQCRPLFTQHPVNPSELRGPFHDDRHALVLDLCASG